MSYYDFLFTYGSLKLGHRNNELLKDQFCLGVAKTPPYYKLYDCGTKFPGLIRDKHGENIVGELWYINDDLLKELDEFEGIDFGLYRREYILLEQPSTFAYAYLYNGDISNLVCCGSTWLKEFENADHE